MVQHVGRIDAEVEVIAVAESKCASQGCMQAELGRTNDRIAARVAPLTRLRRRVSGGAQKKASRRPVERCSGRVRTNRARNSSPWNRRKVDRRRGQPAAGADLARNRPLFE